MKNRSRGSRELLQEAHVAVEEQLDIVNTVLEHGDALDAHAECEAGNLLRVVAIVFMELEDFRVHHAAAKQLDPATCFAQTARLITDFARSATLEATDLDVGAGL